MSCKNCPEKFHPIAFIVAILAWIAIIIGIIKLVIWLGWVNLVWLGVLALCLAFGKCAGDADSWYREYKRP